MQQEMHFKKYLQFFLLLFATTFVFLILLYSKRAFLNGSITTNVFKLFTSENQPTKVLLFCYMRGGSTFFSQYLRQNPDVLFWFEPYEPFYEDNYGVKRYTLPADTFWDFDSSKNISFRRIIPAEEKTLLQKFHDSLFSCDFSKLSTILLLHKFTTGQSDITASASNFTEYTQCVNSTLGQPSYLPSQQCLENVVQVCGNTLYEAKSEKCYEHIKTVHRRKADTYDNDTLAFKESWQCLNKLRAIISSCIHDQERLCKTKSILAYKTIRLEMSTVQEFLQNDPSLKVIYFTRDPRAIAASRVAVNLSLARAYGNTEDEARFLCRKMQQDIKDWSTISRSHPQAALFLKYEDVVRQPLLYAEKLYRFLGTPLPNEVKSWISNRKLVTNSSEANRPFSALRQNWTLSLDKWRDLPSSVQERMYEYCEEVLKSDLLGYENN